MSGTAAPLLRVENLRKRFEQRELLNIKSIDFAAGTSYVLTGDNGAGKTTLLKILAGLEPVDQGVARFSGRSVEMANYPTWLRREILYVHQHPYLFDTSVAANIAYGLRMRGASADQIEKGVAEAMAWGNLEALRDTSPNKLSGGEKQRVALARAWILHPPVLLFDEPTANLDQEARRQTIALIQRTVADNNCVVLACHDHELINLPHMRRLHLLDGAIVP